MTESSGPQSLELDQLIGFSGQVPEGLVLHPNQRNFVYPLGSTIVIGELTSSKEQRFLQGHSDRISALTISHDGKWIASGQVTHMGFQADIIVWDFATQEIKYRLTLHKAKVQALSFSRNDSFLASLGGQDDNSLVIWDMQTGKAICGSPAANDPALTVKWVNTTESTLITAGVGNLRVWELDLKQRKIRFTDCALGHLKRNTLCLVVDPTDTFVYCGTDSGDLLQVSVEKRLYKASGPAKTRFSKGIHCVALTPSGDIIVGSGDGTLAVLKNESFKILRQATILGGVTSLALASDGKQFYCGTSACNVYRVEYGALEPKLLWSCHHERINDIVFPANYSKLFATASIGFVCVWNCETGEELLRISVPNVEALCLFIPQDGKSIVSGWSDGKVRAFTPETGKQLWVINDAHSKAVTSLTMTTDGSRLVTGGADGQVRVWRISRESQQMIVSMKEHKGVVTSVQMTRDNAECVSASADGSCIIWDMNRFTRTKALFESTFFKAALYHPDESQILTTGTDRKIAFWDAADGTAIREVEGSRSKEMNTISISADGDAFASGGSDKLVKLWSYDEGLCYFVGVGHSAPVQKVKFSPDQRKIVSVSEEGAIFVWNNPMVQ